MLIKLPNVPQVSIIVYGIHVWVFVCMFVYNCLSIYLIMMKGKQIKWLKGIIDFNINTISCNKQKFLGILFSKLKKVQGKKYISVVNQASMEIKWKIIAALH